MNRVGLLHETPTAETLDRHLCTSTSDGHETQFLNVVYHT